MRPLLFLIGLMLGLSHYQVWLIANAALDARNAAQMQKIMLALSQNERTMDYNAALIVDYCAQLGGDDCTITVGDFK